MTSAFVHQSGLAGVAPLQGQHHLARRTILGAAAASAVIPGLVDAGHAAQQPLQRSQSDAIVPFRISILQEELDGLRARRSPMCSGLFVPMLTMSRLTKAFPIGSRR